MSHFKGKKVIVTGASSGIGEATAKEFLTQGAKVILVSRSEEKMRDSFKDFSNESYAIYPFDLSKLEDIESFVDELVKKEGPIDILFNNAGIGSQSYFEDTDLNVFHELMNLDYFSVVHFTKAMLMAKEQKALILHLNPMNQNIFLRVFYLLSNQSFRSVSGLS